MKPQSLKKEQFLAHWRALPENQAVSPNPVPYKHEGSTYAEFGIRITGTRAEIDSVLSCLKQLLRFEANTTRLQTVYKQSVDRESGQPVDSWNCYVQVHERGREAQMVNNFITAVTNRSAVGEGLSG